MGGDPSTWGPQTTPEVVDIEPTQEFYVGGDPSSWAPETKPVILGGDPSSWAP